MKMYSDYHVHTYYSDDSTYLMENVIKDAITKGMDEICFTDHVDYGIKKDWDEGPVEYLYGQPQVNVDYPKYFKEIESLRKKYPEIIIRQGMEFGVQVHTIPRYQKLYERYDFDFIILSIHQVNNQEFWTQDYQKEKSQQEYIEGYYQEMLNVVKKYKNYSVLGHLDLMTRYDEIGNYPFEKVKSIITEILKTVIQDGKGIEINTSSHRYGLKDSTPSRDILKLYKELGGKIITIGSDSHKPEHLGAYIDEAKELLKEIGFDSFCTFEKMKPIFHQL